MNIYMKQYTQEQYEQAKYSDKLQILCPVCNTVKTISKKSIHEAHRRNLESCCSPACASRRKRNKIETICKQCGKPIKRLKCHIAKSKYQFCTNSCSASYWNVHKTWGTNRSKLEYWIEEQLNILYPDLKILYNDVGAIESELDIYIPALRLAFELNGIFHYEQIFSTVGFERTQNRDKQKIIRCYEKNIELVVIDTSSQKQFSSHTSSKFLSIIQTIIDLNINRLEEGTRIELVPGN